MCGVVKMKYIKSKPIGNGLYDHSEVIEAYKKGARFEAKSHYAPFDWFDFELDIDFNDLDPTYKYRVSVESEPEKEFIKDSKAEPSDTEILDWFMPFMNDIPKLIEFRRLCTTLEEGVTREAIKAAMQGENNE